MPDMDGHFSLFYPYHKSFENLGGARHMQNIVWFTYCCDPLKLALLINLLTEFPRIYSTYGCANLIFNRI